MTRRYSYRTEIVAPEQLQAFLAGLDEADRCMTVHQELVAVGGKLLNPGQPNVMVAYRVFIETDLQPWPPALTESDN